MSKSQMVIRKTKAAYLVKAWEENTGSGIEAEKKSFRIKLLYIEHKFHCFV